MIYLKKRIELRLILFIFAKVTIYITRKEAKTLKAKINITTVLKIVGLALGLAGTIVSGMAADRQNKEVLADLVKEELGKTQN
jgi:hypothetical protein